MVKKTEEVKEVYGKTLEEIRKINDEATKGITVSKDKTTMVTSNADEVAQ